MQIVDEDGNPVHDQPETELTVTPAPHSSMQSTTHVSLPALKDGGTRKTYSTGAQKEDDSKTEGKGAYHLLPQYPIRRVAEIYRKGAMKYSARNWEKGIPLARSLDSAERHLAQFHEGMEDEDHLHQAIWNLFAISHTMEMIRRGRLPEELNDLPSYGPTDEKGQLEFGWREPGPGLNEDED
jgi:hypothetical protein